MVLQTMKAYSHLMNAYGVDHIIACATSAMRDARNSEDLIRKIKLETGISIEIISGELEASIIYENHIAENMDTDHSYLYIDVGGGSTELTFFFCRWQAGVQRIFQHWHYPVTERYGR